ncbi:MAG: EAL domain-containing protein [Rubrivivax sp.]
MTSVPTDSVSTPSRHNTVRALIEARALVPHFQPIVQLADGTLFAHEALIRTPADCPWRTPDALFAAARAEGLSIELELECVRLALYRWSRSGGRGKLFVNLSAGALVTALAQRDIESILSVMHNAAVAPSGVVVELTEHEHVRDFDALAVAVRRLRRHGAGLALDDFGDGRSSLRLWSELKPEIVKIDKYFTHDLPQHAEKLQTLRALAQISQTLGSQLVAEGIETADELRLVRDLNIGYGQGWLLGRPAWPPAEQVPAEALEVIRSKELAVFPERRRNTQQRATPSQLLDEVPALATSCTNQELFDAFAADESLRAVAIVDGGRPLGIVGRQQFVDRYAKPYFKELFGRRPCTLFANLAPRILDLHAGLDELTAILTSEDQRYLAEGVIITEGGRYRGLGSGEQLVRTVTEARIEAARHANPLTLLPGNIPITQHIERLLRSGRDFVACYADLNHFKPFNDQYGYWRGDEMILLASRCITAQADPRRDFVGHVGGDDFIMLFQSDDWDRRCESIVESFNQQALDLYDEAERLAGGVEAEDRHGVMRFHPLTTISIGVFRVPANTEQRAERIASGAAAAKRRAKAAQVGVHVVDALG